MQHYAAVNHICNALKHNAEVEVYGENKKGEMPKKENARAVMWEADKTEWREDVYKYAVGVDCTQYANE